jgi:PAS domain S-box-containing protein
LFAAIAGSRLPSLLSDPSQAGNPVVHANRALADFTGYSAEELLGRDFAALLQGAGNAGALARLEAAIAGPTAIELELEIRRKNGTGVACALFASPVQGADGRLRYFFCTLLDVARRGAQSTEVGREKLGDLNELARSVGHEFNNLLTIIRTNLEPLQQDAADPLTEKRLGRVALGVDRATELVRTFVAKVRGGEPPARPGSPALPRARGGETILVVEPDEVLGTQAGSMLRGLGYQVQTVADAKAALRWLSGAARVDVMLARSEDALALAKRARATAKGLPILYSTESTAPQSGDTVGRPFQIVALARAIRAAIDGAGKSSR